MLCCCCCDALPVEWNAAAAADDCEFTTEGVAGFNLFTVWWTLHGSHPATLPPPPAARCNTWLCQQVLTVSNGYNNVCSATPAKDPARQWWVKERPVVESHSSQSRSSIGGAVGCCGGDDVMIVIVVLCCCEGYDYHISFSCPLSKYWMVEEMSPAISFWRSRKRRESQTVSATNSRTLRTQYSLGTIDLMIWNSTCVGMNK